MGTYFWIFQVNQWPIRSKKFLGGGGGSGTFAGSGCIFVMWFERVGFSTNSRSSWWVGGFSVASGSIHATFPFGWPTMRLWSLWRCPGVEPSGRAEMGRFWPLFYPLQEIKSPGTFTILIFAIAWWVCVPIKGTTQTHL